MPWNRRTSGSGGHRGGGGGREGRGGSFGGGGDGGRSNERGRGGDENSSWFDVEDRQYHEGNAQAAMQERRQMERSRRAEEEWGRADARWARGEWARQNAEELARREEVEWARRDEEERVRRAEGRQIAEYYSRILMVHSKTLKAHSNSLMALRQINSLKYHDLPSTYSHPGAHSPPRYTTPSLPYYDIPEYHRPILPLPRASLVHPTRPREERRPAVDPSHTQGRGVATVSQSPAANPPGKRPRVDVVGMIAGSGSAIKTELESLGVVVTGVWESDPGVKGHISVASHSEAMVVAEWLTAGVIKAAPTVKAWALEERGGKWVQANGFGNARRRIAARKKKGIVPGSQATEDVTGAGDTDGVAEAGSSMKGEGQSVLSAKGWSKD